MPSRSVLTLRAFLALCCVLPGVVGGQPRAPQTALDLSAGISEQRGGETRPVGGVEVAVLFSWRVRPAPLGALVVALAGTAQPRLPLGGSGLEDEPCGPRRRAGCDPSAPTVRSVGVVGGWELQRGRGASLRLLGGPAYYWLSAPWGRTVGLQSRLDLATPTVAHVALLASARGAVLPRVRGERLTHAAYGFGFRIQ